MFVNSSARRAARLVLPSAFLVATAAGCGTMHALGNDREWPDQVYAGTRAAAGGHMTQWDVPFSLVADTLVLPFTLTHSAAHSTTLPAGTTPEAKIERRNAETRPHPIDIR